MENMQWLPQMGTNIILTGKIGWRQKNRGRGGGEIKKGLQKGTHIVHTDD